MAYIQADKATNLMKFAGDIYSKPRRSYFMSEQQKTDLSKLSTEDLQREQRKRYVDDMKKKDRTDRNIKRKKS
jgi:DNA-binding transcriptional regulator YhcF (GntR family)